MKNFQNIQIFQNSRSTLKETSKDDTTSSYMTDSALEVVNFDSVKDEYVKKLALYETPASADAFHVDGGNLYLVEFKNGYMDALKIFEVRKKIFDSLLILLDIIKEQILFSRQTLVFILVYNENKNPDKNDGFQVSPSRAYIANVFSQKGTEKFIRFNLQRFERLYFKEVWTVTEQEFEVQFVSQWKT